MNLDYDTYILYRDKVIGKLFQSVGLPPVQTPNYQFDRRKCFELSKVVQLPYKGR